MAGFTSKEALIFLFGAVAGSVTTHFVEKKLSEKKQEVSYVDISVPVPEETETRVEPQENSWENPDFDSYVKAASRYWDSPREEDDVPTLDDHCDIIQNPVDFYEDEEYAEGGDLEYYPEDDILLDEKQNRLDIVSTIGRRINEAYAFYDDDVAYIRNRDTKLKYRVFKVDGPYEFIDDILNEEQ